MKKIFTLLPIVAISFFSSAQNSLLKNPTTGNPFTNGVVGGFEIISNKTDVALVVFDTTAGKFHVIDIEDNDPDDAAKNQVTSIKSVMTLLEGATGQTNIRVVDMQVNPISKSIYVMATNFTQSFVVKIAGNGNSVSLVDMNSVTHSTLNWGANGRISLQDMTWGDETLYISSGSNWALDGQVAWTKAPFEHNTTLSNRATSMHKTNWGGGYFTNAPLEKFAFATINGENRIMGVTLCAPGFSVKTSDLAGNGVLEVTEDFNINFEQPAKVVHQKNGDDHFLFNLHAGFQGGQLQRVGQKFLDGTPGKNSETNTNTKYLRGFNGQPTPGLTDDEFKIYQGNYDMIGGWDDENLLVLQNDELTLLKTYEGNPVSISSRNELQASVYPNPAVSMITLTFQHEMENGQLFVNTSTGKEVHHETISGKSMQIDLSDLASGTYLLKVLDNDTQEVFTEKLTVTD